MSYLRELTVIISLFLFNFPCVIFLPRPGNYCVAGLYCQEKKHQVHNILDVSRLFSVYNRRPCKSRPFLFPPPGFFFSKKKNTKKSSDSPAHLTYILTLPHQRSDASFPLLHPTPAKYAITTLYMDATALIIVPHLYYQDIPPPLFRYLLLYTSHRLSPHT